MATVYESKYYNFDHCEESNSLVFQWKTSTEEIDDNAFQEGLSNFAGYAMELRVPNMVVNLTNFRGRPSKQVAADWRKEIAVPRYNKAGIRKFAYLKSEGQSGPAPSRAVQHPGESFETAVFDQHKPMMDWLKS